MTDKGFKHNNHGCYKQELQPIRGMGFLLVNIKIRRVSLSVMNAKKVQNGLIDFKSRLKDKARVNTKSKH